MSKNQFRVHGVSNSLWNEDLAPIAREDRVAGKARLFSAWSAMAVCIPAWLLASGLIVVGMTGLQALGTILLGSVIALVVAWLCGDAGARYGIPSAVLMRASFGVVGAQIPAVLRALVTCAWFGIQCWVGGLALFAMLKMAMPQVGNEAHFVCFAAFLLLNVALAMRGRERSRTLQRVGVALLLAVGLGLLLWGIDRAGVLSALATGTVLRSAGESQAMPFKRLFGPSLTAVVGFGSLIALNASDLTRCEKSQRGQGIGTRLALIGILTLYATISVAVTRATAIFMPGYAAAWNPVNLFVHMPQPIMMIGLLALVLGSLGVNLTLNVEGPATAFSNLMPLQISYRTGVLITGLLGVGSMPWLLIADPTRYLHGWLLASSSLLGPIVGVVIADYFVLRRRSLDVDGLYVRAGEYEYSNGFNVTAIKALTAGMIVAEAGLFLPRLHWLYEYAWFVGCGVAALTYLALMRTPIERAVIPPTPLLIPLQGFEGEGA